MSFKDFLKEWEQELSETNGWKDIEYDKFKKRLRAWAIKQAVIMNAFATQQDLISLYDIYKAKEQVYSEIANACAEEKVA